MVGLGLVHFRGGNLVVTNIGKLIKLFGQKLSTIKLFSSKRKQKLALLAQIIGRKLEHQQKRINQKLTIFKQLRTKKLTNNHAKVISKCGGLAAFEKSFKPVTFLSNKKISQTLFISYRTASKYQSEMAKEGIIDKSSHFVFYGPCDLKTFKMAKSENRALVLMNNVLYRQLPNKISLSSFSR